MKSHRYTQLAVVGVLAALAIVGLTVKSDTVFFAGSPPTLAQSPLYLKDAVPPLNMLVMGKDHKIYYEAYNDASDLNSDGVLDVGYKPSIDYYGYFNSHACYAYVTDRFVPTSATTDKTCSGAWSGDFLNYLTTSRMDALRRVLYGGWRVTDTETDTTLQGAFFPQDAHSWGKEYKSVARDGYDIRNYAPVGLPAANKYHLFAVTTVADNTAPLFRVMQNSEFRVWNWLSIEGPVAGNKCFTSSNTRVDCVSSVVTPHPGHPETRGEFNTLETNNAVAAQQFGSGAIAQISCDSSLGQDCNPYGADENFMSIVAGSLYVPGSQGGTYQFGIAGDDAVDFEIRSGSGVLTNGRVGWYGGHGMGTCSDHDTGNITLNSNTTYTIKFRHEEAGGGEGYRLCWRKWQDSSWSSWQTVPASDGSSFGLRSSTLTTYNLSPVVGGGSRTDYSVRVQTCPGNEALRDAACKLYPSGHAKPTGILHDYGESQKMYFGLITGSQFNNLEGGVLRRNITSFKDEIIARTGQFDPNVLGIARTIDKLRMIGGSYANGTANNLNGDSNWSWNGGYGRCNASTINGDPLTNGLCRMWGNPIAEMMYESLRYFAGAGVPTTRFSSGGEDQGDAEETAMGIGQETWKDPYEPVADGGLGYPSCAKPYQTIISDINPSYDGDLPGSGFDGAATAVNDTPPTISGFDAAAEGQAIWNAEFGSGTRSVFIGESAGVTDGAPTAKSASSFGNIRGLSPEEPTKGGSYYSASVARFGQQHDINAVTGEQRLGTYSIALASPLPRIEFPVGGRTITLLPFAKTVSGTFGGGTRKPTNTIVDFYVETIANLDPSKPADNTINGGLPYAIFRINYEDVEQGNDHDMDAIVRYEIKANSNSTATVTLLSEYAAGSANQNIGYVISGTTKDGIYLEVRDTDSAAGSSLYTLNTPEGAWAGDCAAGTATPPCNQTLGFSHARTFSPSGATGSSNGLQLQNPLWYAAKYGASITATGDPDNYFLVTNPLQLRAQMAKAFDDISNQALDVGSAAVSGTRVGSSSFTVQPSFQRGRNGKDWTGNLTGYRIVPGSAPGTKLWDAQSKLPPSSTASKTAGTRNIIAMMTPGVATAKAANDFQAANLAAQPAAQVAKLGLTASEPMLGMVVVDGMVYSPTSIVNYLRGDTSQEEDGSTANKLRQRSSVLGDIVNSEPVVALPKDDYGYANYGDSMFSDYAGAGGYLSEKRERKAVAYIGANDGMLHAFDASTMPCEDTPSQTCQTEESGDELFAFIPNAALGRMGQLVFPDSNFSHQYYVDGQMVVADAKDGGTWKTLLVGTTAAGGRSIFALDVTDPESVGPNDALWEYNQTTDTDIGYTFGKPVLVPLQNNKWGVLFGNGYGGSNSDPSLYIVDAFSGALIAKIRANDGDLGGDGDADSDQTDPYNGLGNITAVDLTGPSGTPDGKVDAVYGADLQGNLWKFDLSAGSASGWEVAYSTAGVDKPLFSAKDDDGVAQPITGSIRVSFGPGNGVMVFFGTGRYFVQGDNDVPADPQVQSLYAVWDNGSEAGTRSALQQQLIVSEVTTDGQTIRMSTQNPVSYFGPDAKRGWYLDLAMNTDADAALEGSGERFIGNPSLLSGSVFFTTFTPQRDSCDPGGLNFRYQLDILSGVGAMGGTSNGSGGGGSGGSTIPLCTGSSCAAGGSLPNPTTGGNTQAPVTGSGFVGNVTNEQILSNTPCVEGTPKCVCTGDPKVCVLEEASYEKCSIIDPTFGGSMLSMCGRQSWRQLR